ncbi:hypothetical protein [Cryptosporangium minutisporangium]|uniref:Uncharacterized protein n=1 Tax=Cryptosporangium minutisporangium TaxID=113569 RepID=A0ABP6SRU1_9ACTN
MLVKKNSLAHTLVQWTSGTDQCTELGGHADRALIRTCTQLRASIESSVREGLLPVGDS